MWKWQVTKRLIFANFGYIYTICDSLRGENDVENDLKHSTITIQKPKNIQTKKIRYI